MNGPVKDIIDKLSLIGKQKDTAQALRDLEEVHRSLRYVTKIVARQAAMNIRKAKDTLIKETTGE